MEQEVDENQTQIRDGGFQKIGAKTFELNDYKPRENNFFLLASCSTLINENKCNLCISFLLMVSIYLG